MLVGSLWGTNTPNGMDWLDGGCAQACNVEEAQAVFSNLRVLSSSNADEHDHGEGGGGGDDDDSDDDDNDDDDDDD